MARDIFNFMRGVEVKEELVVAINSEEMSGMPLTPYNGQDSILPPNPPKIIQMTIVPKWRNSVLGCKWAALVLGCKRAHSPMPPRGGEEVREGQGREGERES